MRKIRYIRVHHSGTDNWFVHAWKSRVTYDYIIAPTGRIQDRYKPYGDCLDICLVGDFDLEPPPDRQMAVLIAVCLAWCRSLGLGCMSVLGYGEWVHRHEGPTHITCPGVFMPVSVMRTRIGRGLAATI